MLDFDDYSPPIFGPKPIAPFWAITPAETGWSGMSGIVGGGEAGPGVFFYLRPGGVDFYRRPGGVDRYKRPL